MKLRNNLYLDREVSDALDALARGPKGNKSRIANDLLKGALARKASAELDSMFKARLDGMSRDIRSGNRSLAITLEALMLFVLHMLRVLPPHAEGDAAAKAAGAQRFEMFIDELGRELAKSGIHLTPPSQSEAGR